MACKNGNGISSSRGLSRTQECKVPSGEQAAMRLVQAHMKLAVMIAEYIREFFETSQEPFKTSREFLKTSREFYQIAEIPENNRE